MKSSITVKQLINCIPAKNLEEIAQSTKVNHQVKKLTGEVILKLLLMSVLSTDKISLRVMEDLYQSKRFQLLTDTKGKTRHTSLSDRLMNINAEYFEQIYEFTYKELSRKYPIEAIHKHYIIRYDSSCIAASAKLLKNGIINGQADKKGIQQFKQIKISVGFDGLFTRKLNIYNEQKHAGDDEALRQTILESTKEKEGEVIVFDRGLKRRKTFAEIDKQGKYFVTRINPSKTYDVIKPLSNVKGKTTATLELISDEKVYLYHKGHLKFKTPFRLIRAQSLTSKDQLFFVTNIRDVEASDITEIYKRRWDIEVFFKFLKQEMNLKHFISYSENGIKVMLYVTLIAAMFIMIYKKVNHLDSFKRAKRLFIEELDTELIKEIVVICGGDPAKSQHLKPT